ncbi:MAG TPA: hypothetical protein DIV86_00625 [Alphaproteobacteria bacterium]|nr:hypothetical protein [Alphaproteobacteria bacterium]
MNGIYAIYYTGAIGSGQGVVIIKDGVISGADVVGGIYDGQYKEINNQAEGLVSLTLPAGAMLVTGASSGSQPTKFDIPINLPTNLGNGQPLLIKTPTGPINIIFKRLRDVI